MYSSRNNVAKQAWNENMNNRETIPSRNLEIKTQSLTRWSHKEEMTLYIFNFRQIL